MSKYNIETITIKVLTQGSPYLQNQMHLSDIEHDYNYGESVLAGMDFDSQSVSEDEMAELLHQAGSEPAFFDITKRDIASEMCQDILNLIDEKEKNND